MSRVQCFYCSYVPLGSIGQKLSEKGRKKKEKKDRKKERQKENGENAKLGWNGLKGSERRVNPVNIKVLLHSHFLFRTVKAGWLHDFCVLFISFYLRLIM